MSGKDITPLRTNLMVNLIFWNWWALVVERNFSTDVGPEGKFAKCVTYDTWGNPDPVLMTRESLDPPLAWVGIRDVVGCCLVPWAAATVQVASKVGAWCRDVTVVWARNTLRACHAIRLIVVWGGCNGNSEESNEEGSEAGHFDFWELS